MKLKSVKIQNFRSCDDSGKFSIDGTTCLVGKNEAGKTAILQALEILNSSGDSNNKYDKIRDYPRRYLNEYKERHDGREAVVATTEWLLEDDDLEVVEAEFGPEYLPKGLITVQKHYEEKSKTWTTHFDERKAIVHLINESNFDAAEKAVVDKCTSVNGVVELLAGREKNTEKHNSLLEKIKAYRDGDPSQKVIDILKTRLPKFLYFSHYDRMSGKISVNQLEQDKQQNTVSEGDSVFLDFLEFAGTGLEELKSFQQSEHLIAKVEAASNKITDRIFEYWSQNKSLSVEFKPYEGKAADNPPFNSGTVMEARVRNAIHRMTVPFSERSAGFIWFFSFLVRFSQVSKTNKNIIILLDEPGLTLHAKAQGDLLRYFKEKLEPEHQVIYSTHSPFMIPPDNLMSVRTVEDIVEIKGIMDYVAKGTKVGDDVLSTDRDTLFPLQGALGYEITQTLFIGKNTLLVEGPSDILYLQAVSAALKQEGRKGLDSRWTICPTGGIDKVGAFVSLLSGKDLHIAVLTDLAKGQKKKVERFRESKILKEGHVYTISDFCDQSEADVEDMFSAGLLVSIINQAYNLMGEHKLTTVKLAEADTKTERKVIQAEAYFRLLPDEIPTFDHFTPSNWLIQHPDTLSGTSEDAKGTLARFEKLFETFNGLLE